MLLLGNSKGRMLMSNDFIPKPDTGCLFVNGRKANDKQPDFVGNYTTNDGKVRAVAGWVNEPTGRISLRFSEKYNSDSDSDKS